MCLALPGRVVAVARGDDGEPHAQVAYGDEVRDVSLACVPEATVGDYVVVHLGYAIDRLDEQTATALLADLGAVADRGPRSL